MPLTLHDFSYPLPEELIAKHPTHKRDESRLLILNPQTGKTEHKRFFEVVDHFKKGDVLVLNDTRVFPARLLTQRRTGGKQEILLVNQKAEIQNSKFPPKADQPLADRIQNVIKAGIQNTHATIWNVIINASHRVKKGDRFEFDGLLVTILTSEGNEREALLEFRGDLWGVLNRIGHIPLPPYINRSDELLDQDRYQTVFADKTGSVAAPTAGLHFTPELLTRLKEKGVKIVSLTLHVGPGTFLPVRGNKITEHKMHPEYYSISSETCDVVNRAKEDGRRVTAVGTTTTRVLEALALKSLPLKPETGWTDVFIYPTFTFKIVDRLITNFHLPESTLLMLVSAFAGRDRVLNVYQEAIDQKYRFFSYGDAMMIG